MKWIEAAERGNVRELLNHFAEGQKVNAEDENGSTALAVAVDKGRAKAVKELLMMGADPKSGGAPYFAIDANRVDILKLLLEHGLNPNGSMRGMPISRRLSPRCCPPSAKFPRMWMRRFAASSTRWWRVATTP